MFSEGRFMWSTFLVSTRVNCCLRGPNSTASNFFISWMEWVRWKYAATLGSEKNQVPEKTDIFDHESLSVSHVGRTTHINLRSNPSKSNKITGFWATKKHRLITRRALNTILWFQAGLEFWIVTDFEDNFSVYASLSWFQLDPNDPNMIDTFIGGCPKMEDPQSEKPWVSIVVMVIDLDNFGYPQQLGNLHIYIEIYFIRDHQRSIALELVQRPSGVSGGSVLQLCWFTDSMNYNLNCKYALIINHNYTWFVGSRTPLGPISFYDSTRASPSVRGGKVELKAIAPRPRHMKPTARRPRPRG